MSKSKKEIKPKGNRANKAKNKKMIDKNLEIISRLKK